MRQLPEAEATKRCVIPKHDELMHQDPSHLNVAVEIGSFTPEDLTLSGILRTPFHIWRPMAPLSAYHVVVNTKWHSAGM